MRLFSIPIIVMILMIFGDIQAKDKPENSVQTFLEDYTVWFFSNNFLTCGGSKKCDYPSQFKKYYSKDFKDGPAGEHPIYVLEDGFKVKDIVEHSTISGAKYVTLSFSVIGEYSGGKYREVKKIKEAYITIKEDQKGKGWKVYFDISLLAVNKKGALKMLSWDPDDKELFKMLKKQWGMEDFSN